MFKRIDPVQQHLVLYFEGRPITANPGDSVAAALLASDAGPFRSTPVSGAPRAPHCMMGVCFECLVEIDGVPNRQACLTQAAQGMQIRRQHGARGVA
jgi:D-hydroxyproline dehydrogenase subunit gamma